MNKIILTSVLSVLALVYFLNSVSVYGKISSSQLSTSEVIGFRTYTGYMTPYWPEFEARNPDFCAMNPLKDNSTSSEEVNLTPVEGGGIDFPSVLPSVFSVSTTKKVHFTKGNLYWDGSALRMEANQYDFRHYNGHFRDGAVIEGSSTATPVGTVGTFFWYSDQSKASGGSYTADPSGAEGYFLCDENHKLTVDGQSDLYELSMNEWTYLINTRPCANSLRKCGVEICGQTNCLIIAPDGYTGTIASFYTAEEWAAAVSQGLVCLPAAGHRDGFCVLEEGLHGYYGSSTPYNHTHSYCLHFSHSSVYPDCNNAYYYSFSIRLVYNVK